MEPDKPERAFYAHDPFSGGVTDLVATRDCKVVVSCGRDGVLRFWEWKYTGSGRRAVVEVTNVVEGLLEAQREVVEGIEGDLRGLQVGGVMIVLEIGNCDLWFWCRSWRRMLGTCLRKSGSMLELFRMLRKILKLKLKIW